MITRIGNIRTLSPQWEDMTHVHVHSTLMMSDNGRFDFSNKSEQGKTMRAYLDAELKSVGIIPFWLETEHGSNIVSIPPVTQVTADGVVITEGGYGAILTSSDCLPVIIAAANERSAALIHVGWRGLANQILPNALNALGVDPAELRVWIGPSIAGADYEVGKDVFDAVTSADERLSNAFSTGRPGHYQLDMRLAARILLTLGGVDSAAVDFVDRSTFSDSDLHSSRRDGENAGKMATVLWLDSMS